MNTVNKATHSNARISSPVLSGLLYALTITIVGSFLLSFVLWLTNLQEQSLPLYIYFIHMISLFIGGTVSGKRSEQRGWYRGGIVSLIYSAILFLIAFLGFDAAPQLSSLFMLLMSVLAGTIGGMVGVNLRSR